MERQEARELEQGQRAVAENSKGKALEKLKLKIDELEKSLDKIKMRYEEKLVVVKEKLRQARLKNIEIIEKVKESKPMIYGLIDKIKAKFKKEPVQLARAIYCVDMGNENHYIRGYAQQDSSGFIFMREAEMLDFSSGTDVVMAVLGDTVINIDHVIMWYRAD